MGIYIRGMEMPTSCNECRFFVDAWCYALEVDDWRNAYNKPQEGERLTGCPLVPVPPHGRLIDADAFSKKIIEIVERQKYDDFYAKSLSVGAILREVARELRGAGLDGFANAPTSIPADKEEN